MTSEQPSEKLSEATPTAKQRHDIWTLLDKIQMDARALNSKIGELRMQVAALNLPDKVEHRCPTCQMKFRGPLTLAEHVYNSHAGPVPEHYLAAERAAGIEVEA